MKRIFLLISQNYDYLIIVVGLVIIYFLITIPLGYFQSINSTMFWASDAQSYRSVADWIIGNNNSTNVLVRPVLYPLIIMIGRAIGNNYGIWGLQFLMWIISGLILYRTLKTTIRNNYLIALGLILYTGNITLMLLTLHALTEVTVILLITILIAWINNNKAVEQNRFWLLVLFIMSLLVLLKPLFISIWLIVLLYRIVAFIYDRIRRHVSWKYFVFMVIAILPILVQLSLLKIKFNQFTVSNIGAITLKNYLFSRVYGDLHMESVEKARSDTINFSQKEIYEYLFTHFGKTIESYIWNLCNNFLSGSNIVNYPKPNKYLFFYMRLLNIGYFIIHVLMIPISIIAAVQLFKKRSWNKFYIIISLMFLLFVIFASSGITFWQGDRIILPGLPIWIILYCIVFTSLLNSLKAINIHPTAINFSQ